METESSGRGVGGLLDSLVESFIPKQAYPNDVVKYKAYVSRLLASRIGGSSGEVEEVVVARMQEQALEIAASNYKNDNWGQKRNSRLHECI